MKGDERVLVVPGAELDRLGRFQGFSPDAERYLAALCSSPSPWIIARGRRSRTTRASSRSSRTSSSARATGVFCYKRGQSQGEARLHRLRSLGVGGHVSEEDAQGGRTLDAYETALRRELEEEVFVGSPGRIRRVGLINDDATPVGRVHLGVVHLYELQEPAVTPREDGLADAGFLPIATVRSLRQEFETWSQICIDSLLGTG